MICPHCKHNAHAPGKCPHDNCGESDIAHGHAIKTDRTRIITYQDFRNGEVSARDITHIKVRKTGND